MAVADRHGLPVAVGIASGQRNEQKLVVDTLKQRFVKKLPRLLIGDKAYDSDPLDAQLRALGVEMIAPHHPRRARKTQDGRKLRRYRRRWHVERLRARDVASYRLPLLVRQIHRPEGQTRPPPDGNRLPKDGALSIT
jgi:hypothetical protein